MTVLTGSLGAGKTTLLNHILSEPNGRRLAAIVNEFGELGIDGDLVVGSTEEVVTLANGCICCSVRGDLMRTLKSVLCLDAPFDGIIIETTGLADPAPLIQTFFMDSAIQAGTRLDAVVTVIDARHFINQMVNVQEAEAQVCAADVVLLNKADLVTTEEMDLVEAEARARNPSAFFRRTTRSTLSPDQVLDRHAFDLHQVTERMSTLIARYAPHDGAIESASLEVVRPLELERLLRWIDSLVALEGDNIMRVKGILHIAGENRRFVLQAVHRIMDGDFFDRWPFGERVSRLVVIGRNLDRPQLLRNLQGCQITAGKAHATATGFASETKYRFEPMDTWQ